jgi:hypothetical protein
MERLITQASFAVIGAEKESHCPWYVRNAAVSILQKWDTERKESSKSLPRFSPFPE